MVCFEITARMNKRITYAYYPEGDKDAEPGVIELNSETGQVVLVAPAQKDYLCRASMDELNALRVAMDEMRKEAGLPALTEAELPKATKDQAWYAYANHAIRRITEEYERGTVLEQGTVMWY